METIFILGTTIVSLVEISILNMYHEYLLERSCGRRQYGANNIGNDPNNHCHN